MKEPRGVRGSPTVRDHGGTGHLGPRTEFVRNSQGLTVRCIQYCTSGTIRSMR